MSSSRLFFVCAAPLLLLVACGDPLPIDDDGGPPDAAPIDAARADAFIEHLDGGPPPTGCDRIDETLDGGAPAPLGDGGAIDPAAFPPAVGPGGPARTFTAAELMTACGYMDFGPTDQRHHNTGFMLDGYLVRPWAHERGVGGVAVFDITDPCNPVTIANVLDEQIRETHSTGFSPVNGRWISTASLSGIQLWDVTDITAPRMAYDMVLEGTRYPDSYMRVVMSTAWQAPFVYVGGSDNGVYVVDATDPTAPELVMRLVPEPFFRVGNVHAIGNLLVVMGSENSRVAMFDISVPDAPRSIPGGSFLISDGTTGRFGRPNPTTAYFGMVNGGRSYHARNGLGGGLAIYDITSPSMPTFISSIDAPLGNGAYVFIHEDLAFVGLSSYGIAYDISDPAMPREAMRFEFPGDFDTITPLGNVAMVSVDDDAEDGRATAIFPWRETPDDRGPRVNMIVPIDGATLQAVTTRVGLTFDEFVAMESVWRGSVQVREQGSAVPLDGWYSGQEGAVNFWPRVPLRPSTTYEVIVPAGGVRDISGNPITVGFAASFTTASCAP